MLAGMRRAIQFTDDGPVRNQLALMVGMIRAAEFADAYYDKAQEAEQRAQSEIYGTPEHEAWLIECETHEG